MKRDIFLACWTFVIGFALAAFVHYYVAHEDPAYLWDWGGYFRFYQDYGAKITSGDWGWLPDLRSSVRSHDYNPTTVIPLSPFFAAFGDSRTGYILGIVLIYLAPAALIATFLTLKAADEDGPSVCGGGLEFVLVAGTALLFNQFWAPTIRGLPGIAGLIPLGLATMLAVRKDFLASPTVRTAAAIGLLIWTAFLFRRWYAYSAFALAATAGITSLIYILPSEDRIERLARAAAAYFSLAAVIVICLVLFQRRLAAIILTTSYSEAYVAYQQPLTTQLLSLYSRCGPVFALCALAGLVLAIMRGNLTVIFCAAAATISFFIFSLTQAPGIQHTLPVAFWLLIVALYPVVHIYRSLPRWWQPPMVAASILWSALVFGNVFIPDARARLHPIRIALPQQEILPLKIENFPEYQRLIAKLHSLENGKRDIVVLASSIVLSDSLLIAVDRSLEMSIAYASQVDARDNLRLAPIKATYAVVADPVPTHLDASNQLVIKTPAESILAGTNLGSGYERIHGPFLIAGGSKAFIYRRIRPLSNDDIAWLQSQLNKKYASWVWDGADTIK